MAGVAVFQPAAMTGALYYLVHSTLAGAALFLITDLVAARRGEYGDALVGGPRFADSEALSGLFFAVAIAVVGLPPLSGFIGKLLILQGVQGAVGGAWIWAVILGTSLIALLGFARAGSLLFWKSAAAVDECRAQAQPGGRAALAPAVGLLGLLVAAVVAAGPLTDYLQAASNQLFRPEVYMRAVLGGAP
ncbi:proton-conducting transporter membrane subunit [Phenylobacterium sp. J426]|uniref:proton-conducting transporter transmembrane domain-containing protein n=1 Tax=Phenylobacterium sp. J426 TaxID=2898439 RepID=UPI002151B5D9|nr:proton-conducting transporter membrane subunit [Phenylobacterium sp. J426]